MNYLVSTEKSLKHWLKKKVTITTAMVVGFLIMGTASFGATQLDAYNLYAENVVQNESTETLVITTQGKTENKDNITVEKNGIATGVQISKEKVEFINTTDANIIVKSIDKGTECKGQAYGITAYGAKEVKIRNEGKIDVTGRSTAHGISIKSAKENIFSEISNSGTIKVTIEKGCGGNGAGILVQDSKNVKITNEEGALIELVDDGRYSGAAVSISGSVLEATKENAVIFTNLGNIKVTNGVAISVTGNARANNIGNIFLTGNSLIGVTSGEGTITSTGTIQVTDKTADEIDIKTLFNGTLDIKGNIVDANGVAIKNENTYYFYRGTTNEINEYGKDKQSVTVGNANVKINDLTVAYITEGTNPASIKSLNIVGDVRVGVKKADVNPKPAQNIKLAVESLNLDANGKLHVMKGDTLSITGSTVNKVGDKDKREAIVLGENSKLMLDGVNFNGADITGESGTVFVKNKTRFDGNLKVSDIKIGENVKATNNDIGVFSSNSAFQNTNGTKITSITSQNGTAVFEIGEKGENALQNSTGKVTVNGNIDFDTSKLTQDMVVDLNGKETHELKDANYIGKDGVYKKEFNKTNNTVTVSYNTELFKNEKLDAVNNALQGVNNRVTEDKTERERIADNIYSGNIYSETVRAAYDSLKLNEDTILSLEKTAKTGELKTYGKALYSKDEYTREGVAHSFDADVETSGLFAGFEYGLSETVSVGTVFSGVKQDVDIDNGSADGDLFYLGVYGTKSAGNYDFTAGLGYQFGKYEADNNIISNTGDKYNSNAINGYVQGKYTADLGDGLSVQPKVKLGYTYLEQDDAKDENGKVKDAEISAFDTEVGIDVVKSVQLEKSKLDVTFGTSYVRTMGDTDETFTFQGTNGKTAEILGAELSENVLRFVLDAEVKKENGFFYNGGFIYEFGSNDTKSYGVNIGVGYKF